MSVIGVHDGRVVARNVQNGIPARAIYIAEFDDIRRLNLVLVQQLHLRWQLHRLQIVFSEGGVFRQYQYVQRRLRLNGCEANLDRTRLQQEVTASLPAKRTMPKDTAVFLAVYDHFEAALRCADAANEEVVRTWFFDWELRGYVPRYAHVQRAVVEEPGAGRETAVVGVTGGDRRKEVGRGYDDRSGRLARGVMMLRMKRHQRRVYLGHSRSDASRQEERKDGSHGRIPFDSSNSGRMSIGISLVVSSALASASGMTSYFEYHASTPHGLPVPRRGGASLPALR